jgi:hypothetical protein
VATLKQDFSNRHTSYQAQIADIQKRLGGNGTQSGGAGGTVKMKAPNGMVKEVTPDQVEHYKSLGATVVE